MREIVKVSWENAYSIGNEKIDNEHKKLFDIASKINEASNDLNELKSLLKELIKYTKIHFLNEENFMKSISYEKTEEHIKLHKNIVTKLNLLIKSFDSMNSDEIAFKISEFIQTSILQHILLEDKKVHHKIRSREDLKKYFIWKDDYKIDDKSIDEEHEELFNLALNALDFKENTDIKSHIKTTINELYVYMKTHFKNEEEYMQKINYEKIEEHKIMHEKIIEEMNVFIKSIPNLKLADFERRLIEYIDIWLINHIIYEDRKIVERNKK